MRFQTKPTISVFLFLASINAFAQQPSSTQSADGSPQGARPKFYVPVYGANLSIFIPSNSAVKDALGKDWTGFGFGFGPVFSKRGTTLRPNLNFLRNNQRSGGNDKIFQVYVGPELRYTQTDPITMGENGPKVRPFSPFAGISLNAVYTDISSQQLGVATKSVGFGGSAFIGTTIGKSVNIELRYLASTKVDGLNLGGTSFTVGVRF